MYTRAVRNQIRFRAAIEAVLVGVRRACHKENAGPGRLRSGPQRSAQYSGAFTLTTAGKTGGTNARQLQRTAALSLLLLTLSAFLRCVRDLPHLILHSRIDH
jgi:hypothetical protein